jgi:hypothetical protein
VLAPPGVVITHWQDMPAHSDDRILWILVGLGLFIAAKTIPASLHSIRQLTEVKSEDETPQRANDNVDHLLNTETLEKLVAGRSYEIRSSAIKIIAERCITGLGLILLLDDLASRDPGKRDQAILALRLFVSHRSVRDSQDLHLLATIQAFHAMVTALVNLLPRHETVVTSMTSDSEGKVECYQMHHGLPFMPPSRYEAYKKQAEQMARDFAERPKERAILCTIPAQEQQLLAMAGFTPLTEYFFNKCARQWFVEDKTPAIPLDSVPDIPDIFWHSLCDTFDSAEGKGGLSGWRLAVSAADRARHVESLLKALWSCRSIAVQALSLTTAISTEQEALKKSPGRKIYDAYCQERAEHFRQLTGGLFQRALESSMEGPAMTGAVDLDNHEDGHPTRNVLPPSPVRPSRRPPAERNLLLILTKLLDINNVDMALSAGLVSRWLYRYPFPCMAASSKQHDVVAFLRPAAWGSDDPVMAGLMHVITSVPSGLKELAEFGLTKITNFHAYWHGGDWYEEWHPARTQDVVMTGGEDTAGILPSTSETDRDQRPGSSWSPRNPAAESQSDEIRRRRRREAMVLSDGDGPLTEGNILQRENSSAALVAGQEPTVEQRLARFHEETGREHGDVMADFRAGIAYGRAAQRRQPLADITGLDQ